MNDRAGAYPLFIPPAQFSGKSIREWTNEQAEGYKAWLLLELDTRVNVLLEYIGLQFPSDDDDRAEFLAAVGDRAESLLQSQQFSERCEGGRQLTNEGYSLAADLGLLVAKLLLSRFEAIYWEIVRGPKAHMSLNRPVLMGFDSSYLDPVGGSIAEAAAVARGDENGAIWKRMFEYWSTKASS